MKSFLGIVLILALLIGLPCLFILGHGCRFVNDALETAHREFDPSALLKKYEWFKNASAALDDKNASIAVYQKRIEAFEESYKGIPRKDWPRDERQQYQQLQAEIYGLKASFNSLAAEYNAQMAKFNWQFCNAGELPKGADVPLPREYKPYILN